MNAWRVWLCLGTAGSFTVLALAYPSNGWSIWLRWLLFLSGCLAATVPVWGIKEQGQSRRLRNAWLLVTLGIGLYLAAALLRGLPVSSISSAVGSRGLLDWVVIAGHVLTAAGLLTHPHTMRQVTPFSVRSEGWLRLRLELLIVSAAAVTLIWGVLIQPALPLAQRIPPPDWGAYILPILDFIILTLFANIFIATQGKHLSPALGWASAAYGLFSLTDVIYSLQRLQGSYQPLAWLDAGWLLGAASLAAANLVITKASPTLPGLRPGSRLLALTERLQNTLPVTAVFAVGAYALFNWQILGQGDTLPLWATVLLGLLLIARQSLRAGEVAYQQYASLVNGVAEPAFFCDANGRFQLVNPALLQTAGYQAPEDLLGKPLELLLGKEAAARAIQSGLALEKDGYSAEMELLRPNLDSLPVYLSLRPLTVGTAGKRWLAGTAHDLSLQKQQQRELRQALRQVAQARNELERLNQNLEVRVAEKTASLTTALQQLEAQNVELQQLDRLKSDFVSLVSHELRAPLTNISGGMQLLHATDQLAGQNKEKLRLVQAEIDRLSHFVETILDLSALDAGRLPLYPAPLALSGVYQTVRQSLANRPGAEGILWEIPESLPAVLADEKALGSILFHLLDNALKYAPGSAITVNAMVEQDSLRVTVSDHGPGIEPASLPMIFDPFYRTDSSDSRSVYGHGLGLYIVKRLAEAMGGTVKAANQTDGGAAFYLTLTLANENRA